MHSRWARFAQIRPEAAASLNSNGMVLPSLETALFSRITLKADKTARNRKKCLQTSFPTATAFLFWRALCACRLRNEFWVKLLKEWSGVAATG